MTISLDSLFLEKRTVISSHPGLPSPSPSACAGSRGAPTDPPCGGGGGRAQAVTLVTGRNTKRLLGVFLLPLPSVVPVMVVEVGAQIPDGPWLC